MSTDQVQQEKIYDDEIDLVQLIRKVWVFKWLLVGLVIVAVLAAGLHSIFFVSHVYRSDALVRTSSAADIASIISSRAFGENLILHVSDSVEEDQEGKVRSVILRNMEIERDPERSKHLYISATSSDPEIAFLVLQELLLEIERLHEIITREEKEFTQHYLQSVRDQIESNEQVIARTEEQIEAILEYSATTFDTDYVLGHLTGNLNRQVERRLSLRNQEIALAEKLADFQITVISEPLLPERPYEGRGTILRVAIAAVLALMLGLFVVFVKVMFEDYDNRNKEV